jgi:uncharacterized repeat protein (TIGR02543 family)
MKKKIVFLLIALLALTMCLTLVACEPPVTPPDEDDIDPSTPPTASEYNVTFDSDSPIPFTGFNTKVKHGEKVAQPTPIPQKTGYTFNHWYVSGSGSTVAYDFNAEVTADLALIAAYSADTFKNTLYLYEKADEASFEGKVSYPESVEGEDGIKLADAMELTYNQDTIGGDGIIPVTTDEDDYFVYWYYYGTEDEDGVVTPISFESNDTSILPEGVNAEDVKAYMLTDWMDKGSTATQTLLSYYSYTTSLTLFARWYSNTPEINVTFMKEANTAEDNTAFSVEAFQQRYPITKAWIDTKEHTLATNGGFVKDGYAVKYWYSLDADGKEVKFVFDDDATEEDDETFTRVYTDLTL